MTNLRKILFIPALLIVFLSTFFSCGEDRWTEYAPQTELDTWIYDIMHQHYLWYNEIPSYKEINLFVSPESFLSSAKWSSDNFSFVDSIMDVPSPTYGFDYSLVRSLDIDTAYNALITYVIPESPAAKAGLKRGDWIMKVDTSYISRKYETALLQGERARKLTMGTWKEVELDPVVVGGETETAFMVVPNDITLELGAAESIEDQPVHEYDVLTLSNGTKVGYLMYNSFTAGTTQDPEKYNNELREVSKVFKAANVQATILDLRYNGGGTLDCAQLLGTILVPSERLNTPMSYLEYNDKNKDKDSTIVFDQEVLKTGVNLDQKVLIVITSGSTAGAAEMLTSGLYKVGNTPSIVVMGSASRGQIVATERFVNEAHRWSVNPVVCTVYNSDHVVGEEDASILVPSSSFAISETSINGATDYSQFLPFGNPNERMLSIALQTLEGTYPPATATSSRSIKAASFIIEKSFNSPASRRFAGGLRIK